MIDDVVYKGNRLSHYSLWELGTIKHELNAALANREEASKHHKFDKKNNKKALEFPPINPEFLKLKNAVELEIRKRQNV